MEKRRDIGDRLMEFSGEVLKVLNHLPDSTVLRKIEDQLVRSVMSVGANYQEARGAHTKADFCYRLQIALKEMREARYWIGMLEKSSIGPKDLIGPISQEAGELLLILSKAVATARGTAKPAARATS